jgi:3-mercaptopyruvate sulfurtransferase SseA
MLRALQRVLRFLGLWRGDQRPGSERDPFAWRAVPRKPQPKTRSGGLSFPDIYQVAFTSYPAAQFVVRPRPDLMADKREVLAAIGDSQQCILNALTVEDHLGTAVRYGRAGHIASSVNVPTVALVDPVTHAYLPAAQLRAQFEAAGALSRERVITYCGGGIAASNDAFVLTLLGVPNVAVYDGSLLEWAADPTLPMDTGPQAGAAIP